MLDKYIDFFVNKNGLEYFLIHSSYDSKLINHIKKIPTASFSSGVWKVKADYITSKYIDSFSNALSFELTDDVKKYISDIEHKFNIDDIVKMKYELRNFQKEGVLLAIKYKKCFIADDMGLGKTIEAFSAVETVSAYPCLVICPASLKLNWNKEILKWLDRTTYVVDGLIKSDNLLTNDKIPDYSADFVIINYDILQRNKKSDTSKNDFLNHKDFLKKIKFKSIIIDESHLISNYKSLRSKAVKELSRGIPYRFALSGTPMVNRPKELISQLDVIDRLDIFGGFWTFAKRYCNAYIGDFGWDLNGASNINELHIKLKNTCFIRRRKEDVLSELPDKERILIPVALSNAKEYQTASNNFKSWLKSKLLNESKYLEESDNAIQLTDNQKKLIHNSKIALQISKTLSAEAIVKIEKLKQLAAKGKLDKVYDFIDNFIQCDEKIIVFAKHSEIYNNIIKRYSGISVHVVGGMTSKQKDDAVTRFQTDDNIKLFIGALDAAGVGLTLTRANTVVFVELGWTSAIHDQAEDRAHRIGQKDFVKCYYFYADGTIEDRILQLIETKRNLSKNIVDGTGIISVESDESDVSYIISDII